MKNKLSKIIVYNIHIQNSTTLLSTGNKQLKKYTFFTPKLMKYLGIDLVTYMQSLYIECQNGKGNQRPE